MKATPEFLLTAHLPQEPEIIWVDFARHTLGRVVVVELLSQGRRVKGLGGWDPGMGSPLLLRRVTIEAWDFLTLTLGQSLARSAAILVHRHTNGTADW